MRNDRSVPDALNMANHVYINKWSERMHNKQSTPLLTAPFLSTTSATIRQYSNAILMFQTNVGMIHVPSKVARVVSLNGKTFPSIELPTWICYPTSGDV